MKRIKIKRTELTTYHTSVELPDEEADQILESPEAHARRLSELCPASPQNWLDSGDADYEVEEAEESE